MKMARRLQVTLLLTSLSLLIVSSHDTPPTSEQTEKQLKYPTILDADNFYDLVVDNEAKSLKSKPWFIKMYAPWCGHCKAMNETWNEFSSMMDKINVGKIDCNEGKNKLLCRDM